MNKKKIRLFATGATRDIDTDKLDFEGFLSPIVIESFAKYMNEHRHQSDGYIRESDNWQKGITKDAYMKSMWRHFHKVWKLHRGFKVDPERVGGKLKEVNMEAALNGVLFNAMGYLFETLKQKEGKDETDKVALPVNHTRKKRHGR